MGDKQWRRHLTKIQSVVSFVFIITENFATTGKLTRRFNWIFFPLNFNYNLLVALFVSLKGKKLKMHYGLQKLIVYCLESLLLRDTTKFHKIAQDALWFAETHRLLPGISVAKRYHQISQNCILHMRFSEFYQWVFSQSCEIWHSFSRTPMRNFLWCYYRWLITVLGLEKCKKECNIL